MAKSAGGTLLSRYHVEAAIAWEHCRAESFGEIDWSRIAMQYKCLERIHPGPMVRLNLAIALSYSSSPEIGLTFLSNIAVEDRTRLRPWWDCAMADVLFRLHNFKEAISHWQDALLLASKPDQRELIAKRIEQAEKKKATPSE